MDCTYEKYIQASGDQRRKQSQEKQDRVSDNVSLSADGI